MKKVILLSAALSCNVMADDHFTLHAGMFSHHFSEPKKVDKYNETHNLIGIEYDDYIAATFINSDYDRTNFIGKNYWLDKHNQGFSTGLTIGFSYGYRGVNNKKSLVPLFLPKIRYKYDNVGINLGYLFGENVLTVSFSLDL